MTAQIDFLPFAAGSGANVEAQAAWAAETALLANGFTAGLAPSAKFNKALRQSSIIAAAVAQYISQQTGADIIDDGTTAAIVTNLTAAVKAGLTSPLSIQDGAYTIGTLTSGTAADAVTLTFSPTITAFSAGPCWWRAGAANTTATPTLKRDGLAAKTIVKGNNLALVAGDIPGAGAWMCSQYDATLDREVLMNPATGVSAVAPALPAGTIIHVCQSTAPAGYLKANGAAVSRATYAALFSAISTTFGAGDGSTTFNLPDLRGEFIRGYDDGRGVDTGRTLGSTQADAMQGHRHEYYYSTSAGAGGGIDGVQATNPTAGPTDVVRNPITDGVNGTPRIAAETRPVNVALLACIKY